MSDVRVQFATTFDAYRVTETPFAVPSKLNAAGLSDVICHLLELEPAIPFDFLVDGQLVRTSLRKHLAQHGLSEEVVVRITYQPALGQPKESASTPQPDWISSVAGMEEYFVSGCYDGSVRLFTLASAMVASVAASPSAISCVDIARTSAEVLVTAGSKDCSLGLYRLPLGASPGPALAPVATVLAEAAITCARFAPSGTHVCSSAWDGTIALWDVAKALGEVEEAAGPTPAKAAAKKRRRGSVEEAAEAAPPAPVATLERTLSLPTQAQAVMGVGWMGGDRVAAGGYDHILRVFDVDAGGAETLAMSGSKVITSVCSPVLGSSAVATGHPDHIVRLWDCRVGAPVGEQAKSNLTSHTAWVSSVAWAPHSTFHIVSGSYDGTVRVWDIRSSKALHTAGTHEGKVLAVAYADSTHIISGGADCEVKVFEQ